MGTFLAMLKIVTLGDEVLRRQASLVPDIDRRIVDLTEAMLEAMKIGKGIGLAGPQVGELKRLFVCNVEGDQPRVFINPQITATSQEQSAYEEGCLSIPGIYADVTRASAITVQAWNQLGRPFTLDAEGLLARVVQHETDHLNGVLFLDHLDERKRGRLVHLYNKKVGAEAS